MTDQNFSITQDLVDLVNGVRSLINAEPLPLDVRVGSAMQDLLGLAFDRIEERIDIGLRIIEGEVDENLSAASHTDLPTWTPILPLKQ